MLEILILHTILHRNFIQGFTLFFHPNVLVKKSWPLNSPKSKWMPKMCTRHFFGSGSRNVLIKFTIMFGNSFFIRINGTCVHWGRRTCLHKL